jgi:hypothetical protein
MEEKINLDKYPDFMTKGDILELGLFNTRDQLSEALILGVCPKETIDDYGVRFKKRDVLRWIECEGRNPCVARVLEMLKFASEICEELSATGKRVLEMENDESELGVAMIERKYRLKREHYCLHGEIDELASIAMVFLKKTRDSDKVEDRKHSDKARKRWWNKFKR